MKKLLNITKYLFLGLLSLVLIAVIGLLLYYQSIYKETPLPPSFVAKASLSKDLPATDKPILFPIPKKVEWADGSVTLPNPLSFSAQTEEVETIKNLLKNRLGTEGVARASGAIKFLYLKELAPQSYSLSIQPNQITIAYGDHAALFYALTTLKQLANTPNNHLPCVKIEDSPDLKTRGAMLDISRGKVPTLETLRGMVDYLADLKYNQLQLYIEGFSFAYPSFKNLWEKTLTPLTPEEIQALDAYCKERFIELVPNQNSLGHMDAWLATDTYKDLAECPEGYKLLGLIDMKSTLAPTNPQSLALVKKISDDLLPNFSSDKFNVNLDEPFELGKSKTSKVTDPKEVTKLYIDYAKQLNSFVNSKGKNMMMWGDMVSKSPENIPDLPKNITLLEWRYEAAQTFENICPRYQKAGLNYLVCPGTSTWSCMTGRTDNMMQNIEDAVSNGIKNGAEGMLITDWGNTPHLQYLTVSYAGLAYGAALSWNNESKSQVALGSYLSQLVFKDKTETMGDLVLELGRYYQFEEYILPSMTTTNMAFMFGIMDKTMLDAINKKMQSGIFELLGEADESKPIYMDGFKNPKIYNAKAILNFIDNLENKLQKVQLNRPDSALILNEYKNAIQMIRLGAKLKQYNNYHLQQTDVDNRKHLVEMLDLCTSIQTTHKPLWMSRNKSGGFDQSMEQFVKLQGQINEQLELLSKNGLTRWANRSLEKLKTAAGVLYLKTL